MNRPLEGAKPAPDPLACFDLDTLLEGAARLRPERIALTDPFESLTFGETDRRACALAFAFGELGLAPGETILLAAGAPVASFVALAAGLRAGLRVALAPAWTDAETGARMALRAGAATLVIAPGGKDLGSPEDWLPAAAAAPSLRLVCSLGGAEVDGVLRLDPSHLETVAGSPIHPRRTEARIVTFEKAAAPVAHAQRTLVAATLDLVARARIGMRLPVISTLAPTTFAGLIAGPIATLLAGASLCWRIPFEARTFIHALEEAAPAHLIVPAGMAPMLAQADLLSPDTLASLVLVTRRSGWTSPAPPPPALDVGGEDERMPIVDLYAYGERAAAPETRGSDGVPIPPAREPHYLELDGARVLALDWSSEDSRARLEGAAVSGD